MLQIDLRAPTIPPDQRVWRLFPGRGYQFLDTFTKDEVGFLDFPGLEIPKVPKGEKIASAPDWIPRVAHSQHIADALWKGDDAKDVELASFERARSTKNRGRLRQALVNFFEEAKAGDFVVVPEPVDLNNVLVGRFKGDARVRAHFRRYGRVSIPARQITWLGKYPENLVSTTLSQSLRHQHPFTLLPREVFLEVFSLAYGSFVYGDHHSAIVQNEKNDFLDADAALLGIVSRLAAAACRAMDEGKSELQAADLVDVLLNAPLIEYTCTQQSDIHSAGFNRYISGKIVALIIAAVIAGLYGLAHYSSKGKLATDVPELSLINSSSNADPQCTARVSQAAAMILKALGTDRTWELCEAARAAQKRAGLKSSATVKQK